MADMFKRYGIKEVCDVTFYDLDSKMPVLYLDTLKVSTMEQTAENTSARGGKGNPELIIWDYNKEITVTLEDALFSTTSMAMMFGDKEIDNQSSGTITRTFKIDDLKDESASTITINDSVYKASSISLYKADGTTASSRADSAAFGVATFNTKSFEKIEISYNTFPGNYKVVGDTYVRSEKTGKDEFFQLVFNKAKIQSEVTLTMEAEGDPTTFSMNLKLLRPSEGKMVELIKYELNTPN